MKTTKKQRERAKRIRELVKGRWCWACKSYETALDSEPCLTCAPWEKEGRPGFVRRRIGRKEVVP
jgi:hypothetical protein